MKVIIIGAGAAGLMAAYELTRKTCEVVVLERENRIGGRIHTLIPEGFSRPVEAAAEFIHGELPLSLSLMKKAKLPLVKASGNFYKFSNDGLSSGFGEGDGWNEFYRKASELKHDCTLSEFLNKGFAGAEYNQLRSEAIDMAQGLDLADPDKLSVFSIREEWMSEQQQYRPKSGYANLLEFLHNEAESGNYRLYLNQNVSDIEWKPGSVVVNTAEKQYKADAVIITSSVGNLKQNQIKFIPEINDKIQLFNSIGFGNVIKIVLEFDYAFWEKSAADLGFLFTPQNITFWTQLEEHQPLLMGWIGNSHVAHYQIKSEKQIIEAAVEALRPVFGQEASSTFKNGVVFTYNEKSASGGGYSYMKVGSESAIAEANKGICGTIWFAGEALHPTGEIATVEAALQSGKSVAGKILVKL